MKSRSETALSLMKMALALLDRDAAVLAACHLQHAIEITEQDAALSVGDRATPIEYPAEHTSH